MFKFNKLFFKQALKEDSMDAVTLINMISNRDIRHGGFNWANPNAQKTIASAMTPPPTPEALKEPPPGEYMKENEEQAQAPKQNQLPPEANKVDPRIMSTNPEINVCPAYLFSICRVSGSPCIYTNENYKQCNLYTNATGTNPEVFEIPLGREQSLEYKFGIKQ